VSVVGHAQPDRLRGELLAVRQEAHALARQRHSSKTEGMADYGE
jgi:hypothetical protein